MCWESIRGQCLWTAQECAKLEAPALPLIPVAVLRPHILIAIPAEEGHADVEPMWQGFYKVGLWLWVLRQVGREGRGMDHFSINTNYYFSFYIFLCGHRGYDTQPPALILIQISAADTAAGFCHKYLIGERRRIISIKNRFPQY